MKINFYLRYATQFGESLGLTLYHESLGPMNCAMTYLNADFWRVEVDVDVEALTYGYFFKGKNGKIRREWAGEHLLDLSELSGETLQVIDYWDDAGAPEQAFFSQPFQQIFFKSAVAPRAPRKKGPFTHIFNVKAPLLQPHETLCLSGQGAALGQWNIAAPVMMDYDPETRWYSAAVDLSAEHFAVPYKYGVWNTQTNTLTAFEQGDNRVIQLTGERGATLLHDGLARLGAPQWRGAGVAIPVFSLRTQKSFGVGEFTDLPALVDWAKSTGLKIIQLLPINDTSATDTWTDSYPYASISAFALHPLYLNIEKVAGKAQAALIKPTAKTQKALNALEAVDYEGVLNAKWPVIRQLYAAQKTKFLADEGFQQYFRDNRHWLLPYAAFCFLKEKYGTANFNEWPAHREFDATEIIALVSPDSGHYDAVAVHYFVQWHLHLQLQAATAYARQHGIAMKGDIPIGIYRYSCDAWVAPELYNMAQQAGAPPDDFAEKGQNWGFPTYNWPRMQADGFAWWQQRFAQMSLYFDAFRIDHILGFFRIWSIPLGAVEGILGTFSPAIPVTERELRAAGIPFDYERLCRPHISERALWELFGADAIYAAETFLRTLPDGRLGLKPEFSTQRQVEAYFNELTADERNIRLRDGLYNLITNVILLDIDTEPKPNGAGWKGAFRFGMEKTTSFQHLEPAVQERLKALYVDYFYRRQDEFWEGQAMDKLPALKRSTNMLICGEDLGMVPASVPGVMRELGILSLEIQRMPKQAGAAFFHPKDAPYLSVVTPSTHDMSTLRGWWEEDRALTQRFYQEILRRSGEAPFFCEPDLNRAILAQHFQSPAMWSIFQLQDLMGMDGELRRENPHDERINVPANPKHYWRYRMHLTLEALQQADDFNAELRKMVRESGRG